MAVSNGGRNAGFEMVFQYHTFRLPDGFFHSLHLMQDIYAVNIIRYHLSNFLQMALGYLQAMDDSFLIIFRFVCHVLYIPYGGILQEGEKVVNNSLCFEAYAILRA